MRVLTNGQIDEIIRSNRNDARAEGIAIGRTEGYEAGSAEGYVAGLKAGAMNQVVIEIMEAFGFKRVADADGLGSVGSYGQTHSLESLTPGDLTDGPQDPYA